MSKIIDVKNTFFSSVFFFHFSIDNFFIRKKTIKSFSSGALQFTFIEGKIGRLVTFFLNQLN